MVYKSKAKENTPTKKLRVSSVTGEVMNLILLTHRYRPARRIFSAKSLIPLPQPFQS